MTSLARRLGRGIYGHAYALLGLTMLMWGGNAVAGRLAVDHISPMVLTSGRWVLASTLLVILMRRQIVADWAIVAPRWRYMALMGAFGFTLFNGVFYVAAHYTTAVNITILQGAMPAIVLIGARLIYGTRITMVQVIGMLVTLVGVAVLASRGSLANLLALQINPGDGWMLIACVFYASYTLGLRSRPATSGIGFFAILSVFAFLTSLPLVGFEIATGRAFWPTPRGWAVLLYVAIFPSLLAQMFFIRGVELIGPGRAGLFINLVPVFGTLLAVGLIAEPFGLYSAVALALVLGGIFIAERLGRRSV